MGINRNITMMQVVMNQLDDTMEYELSSYENDDNFEIEVKKSDYMIIVLNVIFDEMDEEMKRFKILKTRYYYDEGELGLMYIKGK